MDLITQFQQLVAELPNWVHPFIMMLAGAVPFIEGEGAVTIGIFGGMNPVVAGVSAALGNFVCVAILVWLSAGARGLVVNRVRGRSGAPTTEAGSPESVVENAVVAAAPQSATTRDARKAARKAKFQSALSRYGVPGVSLMGPLLLPTHFTAMLLAAAGVKRGRVLFWQGVTIVLWTSAFAVMMTLLLRTMTSL